VKNIQLHYLLYTIILAHVDNVDRADHSSGWFMVRFLTDYIDYY